MNISDRAQALRRTYPLISTKAARYMHKTPDDIKRRGATIKVWLVMWSDDGRATLHHTSFNRLRPMSVTEWAGWLQAQAPDIFVDRVLPYVNRSYGSAWNIARVLGWHFSKKTARTQ